MTYGHVEADTEIVPHATDIWTRNPLKDLSVVCDNTDMLLILLHFFRYLSVSINFVIQHYNV